MKGLIYKDFMALWRTGKSFLLVLVVFSVIPMMSLMGYGMAFTAMLPFTLIQFDENAKWGRLSMMLPYSNLQLTLSKYIVGWCVTLAMATVSIAAQLIGGGAASEVLLRALFLFAASSVLSCVVNPIAFRFGTQRGRLVFIMVVVVFTATMAGFGEHVTGIVQKLRFLPLLAPLLILLVNATSIYLSQRWFRQGVRT